MIQARAARPSVENSTEPASVRGRLRAFLTTHHYSIAHLRYCPPGKKFESGMTERDAHPNPGPPTAAYGQSLAPATEQFISKLSN
jgi:hypothetical protein